MRQGRLLTVKEVKELKPSNKLYYVESTNIYIC